MMSLRNMFTKNLLRKISISLIVPWIFTVLLFSEAQSLGLISPLLISAPIPSIKTANVTSRISVELPEGYLCNVLAQLEEKSGIRLNCPEKLGGDFTYARTLEGPDWESVVHEFLEEYSTIEFWDNKGGISKIYLMGNKGQSIAGPQAVTSTAIPNPQVERKAIPGLPGSNLNRSQLFALLKTSTFKPFPQHFFNIPDYQEILNFAGIKKPEDWMVVEKSRTLKKHIQTLLKK